MAIRIMDHERDFYLETNNTMYQMKVDGYSVLKHIWYGKKVAADMEYLLEYNDVGFSGNIYEATERAYSLDTQPQEYPTIGTGDYRISAAAVTHENGSQALDLRYQGYQKSSGKYEIPGLPAVYAKEAEAETLEIYLKDTTTGIRVILKYGVLPELDIITRSAVIENEGKSSVLLNKAHSLCLDVPNGDWEWVHFHGRHEMERQPQRAPLLHGIQESSSMRGTSSHQQNPASLLCAPDCTETSGACLGAMLMYSGSFQIQAELSQQNQVRLVMGLHPDNFCWEIKAGEKFYTPEAVLSYSSHGFGDLSRQFHRVIRNHICRGTYQFAERPVLINNWEATYFDFDETKMFDIAKEAKRLGVDMLVMDDGWFGKRDDDFAGLGDWFVNEQKIKGGLGKLVDEINGLGMQFGIWFEPEMVSEDSNLYREHPDWAIQIPGRSPVLSRSQLVLDMSRQEVRDYLFLSISNILNSANIQYVKWDMNRSICDWHCGLLPAHRQKELPHRYVLGLYELLERLTGAFPKVLFEGCSGGGGRFDAGMLYYCPQIWCSDDTDAFERVKIQYGTSFFYPISAVGSHVSAVPNHQTGRITEMETRSVTAMAGSFGYELDLNKISDEEKEAVKEQIIRFKKYGSLIHNGSYYRLSNPLTDKYGIWSYVSADKTEALVHGMIFRTEPNMRRSAICLQGIDPKKMYQLMGTVHRFLGQALLEGGILLPKVRGDYAAIELHFKEVPKAI